MLLRSTLATTLLAGTAFVAPGMAHAQQAAPVAAAAANADPAPEATQEADIVVTAQKRSENVQQVPINIRAFNAAALTQNSIFSPADIQRIAPSFKSTSSIGTLATRFSIRGIGTFGNSAIEPSVATFIDGIYVPRPASIVNALLDIDGVEVLSGPQGTLFGRNASVGAVTYRTATPGNTFSVGFKSDYTTGNRWRNEGFVNVPLTDGIAVRAAVLADKFDGYWHDDLNNRDFGGLDTFEGRVSLKAAITPQLTWIARVDGQTNTGDGAANTKLLAGTYTPTTLARLTTIQGGIQTNTDPYGTHNNTYNLNNRIDDSTWSATSDLSLSTSGGFTLRLLDGYYDWNSHQSDGDTAALSVYVLGRNLTYRSKSNSHELQVISPKDKLLDGKLDFVGGLYYYHEDLGIRADSLNGSAFCSTLGTYTTLLGGVPGATAADKIAACQSYSDPSSRGDFQQATRSIAGYVQATIEPIEHVFITGGGRYTDERKSATYVGTAYNPTAAAVGATSENTALYLTDHRWTWRANVAYRPTRELMFFATASTGFKSGGFNNGIASVSLGQARIFLPETVKNYEIGAKTQLFDRMVTFNVTGFRMDIDNFQERSIVNTTSTIRNVGKVRQQGFELDTTVRPIHWLTLNGSATYVDSNILDYANAPRPTYCPAGLAVATAACPATATAAAGGFQLANLAGNPLTYNPAWTVVGGATVEGKLTSTGWRWSLGGDANYISSQKMGSQIDNNPILFQSAYTLFNARLTVFSPNDHYSFAVFARNLTNKGYCAAEVFQVLSGPLGVNYDTNGDGVADGTLGRCLVGAPRVIGGSFKLKF